MNSEAQRVALATVIRTAKEAFPMIEDLASVVARERMAQYKAYKAAGFTDAQAMQMLCAAIRGVK